MQTKPELASHTLEKANLTKRIRVLLSKRKLPSIEVGYVNTVEKIIMLSFKYTTKKSVTVVELTLY